MHRIPTTSWALLLLVAGCSGPSPGGSSDSGPADAGEVDGGPADGGPSDGGTGDGGASDAGQPTLGLLTPAQLNAALATKDFLLIDVHIPHDVVVPGTDTRIAFNDVDGLAAYIGASLDRKVVLTCMSGGMSKSAGDALVARGYRSVSHLFGGMTAWVGAGYPVQ